MTARAGDRRTTGLVTRLAAAVIAAVTTVPGTRSIRAEGRIAPALQTFPAASAGLHGCLGLVRPRAPRPVDGVDGPLLAAWSLDGGWGVMRTHGQLQRFPLAPARRWSEPGGGASQAWRLEWRVGRIRADLRFRADRLSPQRWGGEGRLQVQSLATGDRYVLPVRVEGGC